MSDDRFLELAPLAALDALDGEDRAAFRAHLSSCAACQAELAAHQRVADQIGLSVPPVPPPSALRARVLAGVEAPSARLAPPGRLSYWLGALATAATVLMAVALVATRAQREEARREAAAARQERGALQRDVERAHQEVSALQRRLAEEAALRELVAHPESRLTPLAGLPPAARATGRVIWNASSRQAVLLASGLDPAPEGKAYEAWVIGAGAPVPAGVFQVDPSGSAVFRLLQVEETARVKTFAVTLEPAAGVPAPTGPMVLAGPVS